MVVKVVSGTLLRSTLYVVPGAPASMSSSWLRLLAEVPVRLRVPIVAELSGLVPQASLLKIR